MADRWEPLSSGNAKFVLCSNWIDCDQANPAVVQTLNPTSLRLYSNNDDSYDSTTTGFKSVFKLATASSIKGLTGKRSVLGLSSGNIGLRSKCVFTVGTPNQLSLWMRIRAITADFDITTLTWNGLGSLTIGATLMNQRLIAAAETGMVGTLQAFNDDGSGGGGSGQNYSFDLNTVASTIVYGFEMDIKSQREVGMTTFSLVEAYGRLGILGSLAPFVYIPLA